MTPDWKAATGEAVKLVEAKPEEVEVGAETTGVAVDMDTQGSRTR